MIVEMVLLSMMSVSAPAEPIPNVLIVGDSISIGYTPYVQSSLEGVANVVRIPENAQHTKYGLAKLSSWLGETEWDVIHFNWGLHDIKYLKDGRLDLSGERVSTLDEYEMNLMELVKQLKRTGAKLIWASTTPVPEGANGRKPGEEVEINHIAESVMKKNGVVINDLYGAIKPNLATYQQPHDVHYSEDGSRFLARQVVAEIRKSLDLMPDSSEPESVAPDDTQATTSQSK